MNKKEDKLELISFMGIKDTPERIIGYIEIINKMANVKTEILLKNNSTFKTKQL